MKRREKVATVEVAEPGDGGGGGVEPGSVGGDWGDGPASLVGGVGVVPEPGGVGVVPEPGGEGEGEEPVTLTLSFWPLLQWPWIVHAK